MSLAARASALVAAGGLIVALFLPWTAEGALALDLPASWLVDDGAGFGQPTIATLLVAIAAVPAIGALAGDLGWPRLVGALATAALTLAWLAAGPDGALAAGVVVALLAAGVLLLTAAAASGRPAGGPSGDAVPPAPDGGPPSDRSDTGSRELDHTADTAFEVWAPSRTTCFAEAVRALVATFADPAAAEPTGAWDIDLPAAADDDLLVDLLEEVIYVVDTRGMVPVRADLTDREDGGITGRFALVPITAASGAVPKAITYHGLEVTGGPHGWRARVTIDV